MPIDVKYTAHATATGGRDGRATVPGVFDMTLATPKELGGGGGEGTNPEQLFAAGYAACFIGAMKFVAAQKKITLSPDVRIASAVGIGPRSDGGFGIVVGLDIHVPEMPRDSAEALVAEAHQVCPYSNATRGNIEVTLSIV